MAAKCPVDHNGSNNQQKPGGCPVEHLPKEKAASALDGGCPMGKEGFNPNNMMPYLKQLPHPDQDFPLPTPRQVSSIPRGGADDKWVYPSPQMFYNAVKRKGGDPDEESMQTVVNIHNHVNEYCWQKIVEWERLEGNPNPRLTRFRGRYDDLSPKARFSMLLGYPRPFDRHDWVINRNGEEVRYVIDYYEQGTPNQDLGGLDMELDVRPALDSFGAWWLRVRKLFH